MTTKDWLTVLSPEICLILGLLITAAFAWWSGMVPRITAWLTAHHQTALAQGFAAANAVLQPALQTGANAIVDKIRTGQLDLSNKASIVAEAEREVALVETRAPAMVALAAPAAGALVASMIGKVQASVDVPAVVPTAVDGIVAAAKTLTDVRVALDAVAVPVAVPVVAVPLAPPAATPTPSLITA